jgi:hypothetical protein
MNMTACSSAVLMVLAGCGGANGDGSAEAAHDKSAEQQEVAVSQFIDPGTDVKFDNWMDDPSLPTPPVAHWPAKSEATPQPAATAEPSEKAEADSSEASSKIVGGSQATESYPYMAALLVNGSQSCGGTLIAPTWVVTAAHCVGSGLSVRLGSANRTSGGQVISVAQTIVHPQYNNRDINRGNDIALLRLSRAVTGITPASIAASSPTSNTNIRLLGWGQTRPQGGADRGSDTLKQLDTRVLPSSNCNNYASGDLCIQGTTSATSCYGDSGGPALLRVNGAWQLAGATSRSGVNTELCGEGNVIYTNVTYFRSWINQYVTTSGGGGGDGGDGGGGTPPPPPPPPPDGGGGTTPPCTNCAPFSGSLVTGQSQIQPNGSYFYSGTGQQRGWLVGPSGTNFDMALFRYTSSGWRIVAEGATSGSNESVSYYGQAGYYYWAVASRSGSGAYTLYLQKP